MNKFMLKQFYLICSDSQNHALFQNLFNFQRLFKLHQ